MQKYFYIALFLFIIGGEMQCKYAVAASNRQDAIASELEKEAQRYREMPRVPVPHEPFLFVDPAEIAAARRRADTVPWAKKLKEQYMETARFWAQKDHDYIQKVIPPWGSIYVYGLGKNLDPIQHKKMKWRGWDDPRHVEAVDGTIYPNATHPDDGNGWTDPRTGQEYFFVALANGGTLAQLCQTDIPNLADAYVLTGDEKYAERGLWLLDAIATIYPRAYEGPIDYPGNEIGKRGGGRLDRPTFQVARAMMRYAYAYELLKNSPYARAASPTNAGYSILENIDTNLLMNGADYCLRRAQANAQLGNGIIDYNRAPLIVGALLGIPQWVDWALNSNVGFRRAISNTIDINGRYFETSPPYAAHSRELLLSTAEALKRMRLPKYPQGYNAYDNERFVAFALSAFTGIQVAERLPRFGDASPDYRIYTGDHWLDPQTLLAAAQIYAYSTKKEFRTQALQMAALMKPDDRPTVHLEDEWGLFHAPDWDEPLLQNRVDPQQLAGVRGNTLLFDYGTVILRDGTGYLQRGALLRFGPTLSHGQADEMGLAFYAKGRDFSYDPGYYNTHLRFGFVSTTVAHNVLVVNRRNQLREPSPGGDLQSLVNGDIFSSVQVNDADAYREQNVQLYKRRVALIPLSPEDSYLIDTFWARGGHEYDESLHAIPRAKLTVNKSPKVLLKESRGGSVLSPDVDYSNELDANGRVRSFANSPFYFAPPGEGFGFLSHPSSYSTDGKVLLDWASTDKRDHHLYVMQFSPDDAELITAHSPNPPTLMDLTYALQHVKTTPEQTVRFTSIILPTAGDNKIKDVQQLIPANGDKSTFALRISKVLSGQGDDMYFAANDTEKSHQFGDDIDFQGEEGFVRLGADGDPQFASLAGDGHIRLSHFSMSVAPLLQRPLHVLEVQDAPLRLRVDAPLETTRHLPGALIKLNRPGMARPFALLVKSAAAASEGSWLTLDAASNVEAVGIVKSVGENGEITTDASFPRISSYLYTYDPKDGTNKSASLDARYNGSFNGLYAVDVSDPAKKARIKTVINEATTLILDGADKSTFATGDHLAIQIFMKGDTLQVPVWGQAIRQPNGQWKTAGPAIIKLASSSP